MTGPAIGATGRQVAMNVRLLREARGLSLRGLSEILNDHGWALSADAINKIENGRTEDAEASEARQTRRVDVDDLTALAAALDVEVAMLLMPLTIDTQVVVVPAQKANQLGASAMPTAAPTTSGRTLMTDHWLRDVALLYIQETAPGKERGVTQRMVEHFGRPQGTVQTWIKRARKEGWLMPGPTGRMGAEPGPRLLEWYASESIREAEVTS